MYFGLSSSQYPPAFHLRMKLKYTLTTIIGFKFKEFETIAYYKPLENNPSDKLLETSSISFGFTFQMPIGFKWAGRWTLSNRGDSMFDSSFSSIKDRFSQKMKSATNYAEKFRLFFNRHLIFIIQTTEFDRTPFHISLAKKHDENR